MLGRCENSGLNMRVTRGVRGGIYFRGVGTTPRRGLRGESSPPKFRNSSVTWAFYALPFLRVLDRAGDSLGDDKLLALFQQVAKFEPRRHDDSAFEYIRRNCPVLAQAVYLAKLGQPSKRRFLLEETRTNFFS